MKLCASEWLHLHIPDTKRQGLQSRERILLVNKGKEENSGELGWRFTLTAFPKAFVLSTLKHGVTLH